jgi:hypothetical protein
MGCLITNPNKISEQQRQVINEGKQAISNSSGETTVAWNAIYSFFFNCLREFSPDEEVFRIKPDPFVCLLNFADRGVLVRTDQKIKVGEKIKNRILVDIPLIDTQNKGHWFYGCFDPFEEDLIVYGHLSEGQNCSCRQPLENGQLKVDNKDHEEFNLLLASRQQSAF